MKGQPFDGIAIGLSVVQLRPNGFIFNNTVVGVVAATSVRGWFKRPNVYVFDPLAREE